MGDITALSDEQLKMKLLEIKDKFSKMRNLAAKVAEEMDSLKDEFDLITNELGKRRQS